MCIICECNVKLTHDEFASCFTGNSHGAGFAWRDNDGLNHYKKGFMTKEAAWEAYQDVPVPHIAHFRLASAGGVSEELTHPFIVSKASPVPLVWEGKESLLFHNGTISDWRTMLFSVSLQTGLPSGGMSDTRFVAMAMSIEKLGIDALCFFSLSKFGMLDTNGKIYRYGTWEQDGENWYSNGGYKRAVYVSTPSTYDYARPYSGSRWGSNGNYYGYGDDDYLDAIPVDDRTCTNCKSFRESKDLVVNPIGVCMGKNLTNLVKCTSWEQKRGRGRPKSKSKAERDARKAEERRKKKAEKDELALREAAWEERRDVRSLVNVDQTRFPFDRKPTESYRTCMNCEDFMGEMKCRNREYPMANLTACNKWRIFTKSVATVGSTVVVKFDENGNRTTTVEERRAL